jgi:hypothetical protein
MKKTGKIQNKQQAKSSETSKKTAVQKAQERLCCIEVRTDLLLMVLV